MVIEASADMGEQRRKMRKRGVEGKRRAMEEEAWEKDLYSGAQTRPVQAHLVWVARKPARLLI